MSSNFKLIISTLILSFSSFIWAAVSTSQVSGITIQADDMIRDFNSKTVTLDGNIQLIVKGNHITAKKAVIHLKSKKLIAEGQVILKNQNYHMEGEKIEFSYDSETGVIHKGFVQSGNVYFEGELIKKTGEKDYFAYNANYTSCTTCPPGWNFQGKEIEAEMGGYAYIKLPIFKIVNIPVMILPGIWVPLKSTRQSGFLAPSIDYSSDSGAGFAQSFFWAMSRSTDATITAKNYGRRGLKGLFEYRFIKDKESKGQVDAAYLKDRVFKKNPEAKETLQSRGFLKYSHRYEMPHDYINRTDLTYISDLRYPKDFPQEVSGHGNPAIENTVSLTKNKKNHTTSIEATVYTNLLKEDAVTNNEDAVHKFPEIRYSYLETPIYNSNFKFDASLLYTQFSRNNFGYDDVTGTGTSRRATEIRDGTFDYSQDLLRTGHRTILQPTVSYPFQINKIVDVLPSVTYNEAQYRFTAKSSHQDYSQLATRRFFDTKLSMKTKFSRVFGKTLGPESSYKHEIEPEITFSRIAWVRRPNHTFFGDFEDQQFSRQSDNVTNQDFFGDSKLQFDYYDRVFDKKIINFSINNYLIRKKWIGTKSQYQNIARLKLQQSYDLNEASRTNPSPLSTLNAGLDLRLDNFETNTLANHYPYADVTNVFSRVRFKSDSGNYLELLYAVDFSVDENNTYIYNERTETQGLGLGLNSKYVNLNGHVDFNLVTSKVSKWSYTAIIKPPGDCWSIIFYQIKNLSSPIISKIDFKFNFGGQ